jgi:hypothetical protein
MDEHASRDLPQEGDDERHDDEEHRVFDGAFGLHVDVDRLHERHAERRRGGLLCELLVARAVVLPVRRKPASEVRDAP